MIKSNSVILFQGDSITDAGRTAGAHDGMGNGFPFYVEQYFKTVCPEKGVKVINRGISGNRSKDLVTRWKEDCIDINPDYLFILIGVNDTWRKFDSNDPTTAAQYEANLRNVLDQTRRETNAEIIILLPYIVLGSTDWADAMFDDLEGKRDVVKKLSAKYGIKTFDLQALFDGCTAAGVAPAALSADGVHPTDDCGHKAIASAVIRLII